MTVSLSLYLKQRRSEEVKIEFRLQKPKQKSTNSAEVVAIELAPDELTRGNTNSAIFKTLIFTTTENLVQDW